MIAIPLQFAVSLKCTVTQLALAAVPSSIEILLTDRAECAEDLSAFVPVAFPTGAEW